MLKTSADGLLGMRHTHSLKHALIADRPTHDRPHSLGAAVVLKANRRLPAPGRFPKRPNHEPLVAFEVLVEYDEELSRYLVMHTECSELGQRAGARWEDYDQISLIMDGKHHLFVGVVKTPNPRRLRAAAFGGQVLTPDIAVPLFFDAF